jgi:hypothetical protein
LLENSAELQWSDDRKALRFAEIAVYAAGAGLEREAADAIASASEALKKVAGVDLRVQRTRLMQALAAIVLGRSEVAEGLLARVDAAPPAMSRRLLALRRALGALYDRYRGACNHEALLARLGELDACGFAGIARTIAMLPLADNASQRVSRLSLSERSAAVRWADGSGEASEAQLIVIARKLGCAEPRAVLRAVAWHREAFEAMR